MATAGPTITGVTRHPSDPTILQVTYTVPVSGVTRVQLWERPQSGGTPVRIVDTSTLNGNISVHSRYAANVAVTLHMTLTHVTEGASNPGGTYNVAAFKVATPTLVSAVRASATQATLTYSGLTVGFGSRCYIYRSAPGGNPVQVDAFDITVSSGSRNAPAPSGTAAYEYEIRVGQHGVLSDASTRRSVDAWYQLPPAPSNFVASRNLSNGNVTLDWTLPSRTARNDWQGFDVFRALKGRPMPGSYWRRHVGVAASFTDATADMDAAYTYWVRPYNAAGVSTSAPSDSVDPTRLPPNPATGASAAHLSGNTWRISWSVNESPERPIWTQQILGRVPGQTATTVLATVMGGLTQHDLTLADNRIYEVSVLTRGIEDASSTSNWTGPVVSAPRAPSSVSASWLNGTQIRVAWPVTSGSVGDLLRVEFSTLANPDPNNGAHWTPGTTLTTWGAGWTHGSLTSAVPHTYRIRSEHTASGLASTWRYSATVAPQSVPLKPTMLMPDRIDATRPIWLVMVHNPSDDTAATAGQFQMRLQGETSWSSPVDATLIGTANPRYEIPADTYSNGGYLEVQGRTAGATGVYGAWSDTLLVPLRPLPTVVITDPPDGIFEAQTLTMTWESVGQMSAELELWDDTDGNLQLMGTATLDAGERSHTWDDVILLDGHAYIGEIVVRDAWQSSETQTVEITVSYNLPAPPALTVEQAAAASVLLQAEPRAYLDAIRYNHSSVFSQWTALDGSSHVGTATLELPDGTRVDTITVDGAATSPESDYNLAAFVIGGFMAYSEQGAELTLERYEGDFSVGSTFATLPPGVPTMVRLSGATGGAAHTWRVHSFDGLWHSWDHVLITWPFGATDTSDESHFDGNTVDPTGQKVYGWLSDGVAYEATPVSEEPDNPVGVAPTLRVEFFVSRDGVNFHRRGEAGATWGYHDRYPHIDVPLWYKARSVGESGAWAESAPVQIRVDSRDTFVHFGPDHAEHVTAGRLVDALTVDGGGLDVESIQYEGHDGWTHHVGAVPLAESISTDLQLLPARGASSLTEWAAALRHRDVIYREPGGIVMRGAPSMGPRRPSSKFVQQLSLTVRGEML